MAYNIERQESTGLWLVTFDGRALGRGEEPITAINLARDRVNQINDPVTGTGNIPPLTAAIQNQLIAQARSIEAAEAAALRAAAQTQTRQSTGETVKEAQTANADGADTQSPGVADQVITAEGRVTPAIVQSPTNAERFTGVNNEDVGTDDSVRKQAQLMATPGIVAAPGGAQPSPSGPFSASNPGAAANPDDNSGSTGVRARLNNLFGGVNNRIESKPNVLDQYSSYTYNISLYLMSPSDYKKLIRSKKRNIAGFQLLMQSGGAPLAGGTLTAVDPQEVQQAADGNSAAIQQPSLGRNQFFPLDYYIDDVQVKSLINGKATGGAHNVTELKFKIIEPNGITFLDNLFAATQQYIALRGGNTKQNYAAQNYLMVIRFYGYDENGNLVTANRRSQDATGSDINATVEKFIPFQFTGIKFRIANKLVEYECSAVCPQNIVATGPARGVIPYNVEVSSQTLKELLSGNLNFSAAAAPSPRTGQQADIRAVDNANARFQAELENSSIVAGTGSTLDLELGGASTALGVDGTATGTTVVAGTSSTQNSAPAKANAAANKTIVSGLADALNKYQEELVNKGTYEHADTYVIKLDPLLESATVTPPGQTNLRQTPMIQAQTAADAKLGAKQKVNNNAKSTKITAGTSIVQLIDQVVRTSSYIYEQQIKIYDPKTGELKDNGVPAQTVGWYRIGMEVEPKLDKYDRKRQDYAYTITYQISVYAVSDVKSDFFPSPRFRGTQKTYDYWFTGKNTQILDFTQDYNYLYYIVSNGPKPIRTTTSNSREVEKSYFQPQSNQTSKGQDDERVNDPSASAADYLYSPGDQSRIKLKILGDPAWIFQGEIATGLQDLRTFNYGPFLPDGTINQEGQEILFEVAFNQPVDYDLETGIADPSRRNYNRTANSAGDARQRFVYKAIECNSIFSQGKFEQELQGVLMIYPLSQAKVQGQVSTRAAASEEVNWAAAPDQSQAETNRLLNRAQEITNARPPAVERFRRQQQFLTNQYEKEFGVITDPEAALLEGAAQDRVSSPLTSSAPTSSGQPIGTASTPALAATGGASGFSGIGVPSVQVVLPSGQVTEVTSQGQIQNIYAAGSISAAQRDSYSRALAVKQSAANSPVNTNLTSLLRGPRDY